MVADTTFTLILTKGTHLISSASATKVRDAIDRRERMVDILLDPFGAVDSGRVTTIVLDHVIAITENPEPAVENVGTIALSAFRSGRRKR